MGVVMYHCTTNEIAALIMGGGFVANERGPFPAGVFVSRVPFLPSDGARGETAIEITLDISEDELAQHAIIEDESLDPETGEWVKDEGFEPYEWLLPEDIANRGARRLLTDEEAWELRWAERGRRA